MYSILGSSPSHAGDTDRVADLCDLARSQDTFTSSEVILEGNRRVSMVGELGSKTRTVPSVRSKTYKAQGYDEPKESE